MIFYHVTDELGASFRENKLLQHGSNDAELLHVLLKLPWTHRLLAGGHRCPWETKCLSLQVASKLGPSLNNEVILEVLDLGLFDEAEEVRIQAVISMPVMVLWSGRYLLPRAFERME